MQNHFCTNLLPNGICKKSGELCREALPSNIPQQEFPTWLDTTGYIPPSCVGCPNHPSNGGSGICNCILGSMNFTAGTSSGTDVVYTTNITSAEE